uniref:Reverse transcriptase domain-containing protein n=1 Tax=Tanacetum cinerariifolium TaxID=118510 RepID=A0A699L3T0_TANCI|nr:reverse transcriptase domain-containing protein [Tanacetum cinerariifolium]
MDECLALADLGASMNLMPLSVWEGLSLPELTPTCMTLELADLSVSKPLGIATDVSFKVGVFHFLADFVVVDFEPNPQVPLILGRCFLKTSRALIDVHKGELTLHIRNEAITYNLDQTVRYSANYNQMTANKIDVVELSCEEYSQEVNQAPVYQAPIPQTQRVSQLDFESYVKANDAILRNMQSQGQSTQNQCQNIQNQNQNLKNQMATLTEMMYKLINANTASSSGSGTLPGNTITNPKKDLKGITTRSGVAYPGPKTPSPSKQGTKVTKDQVQTTSSQSTTPVQPSVIQSESQDLVSEPVVTPVSAPIHNLKPSIPYPSRCNNENAMIKLMSKSKNSMKSSKK